MAPIMALSIVIHLIVIGSNLTENQAMVTKKLQTDGQESNKKDRESDELQLLLKNAGIGRVSARGLTHPMEMIDQKRQPKPKHPMGNDIGTARLLHPSSDVQPKALPTSNLTAPDHLEATVSVDFVMAASNTTSFKDEESAEVSRQLHEIIDSVPTLPAINIPHMQFYRDPEEEALNQRITEVARQLAETALRKEYEAGILGHVWRLPVEAEQQASKNTKIAADGSFLLKNPKRIATGETEVKNAEAIVEKKDKPLKAGRSFFVANTLPLVSQLPHETAPLQLISEVQSVPHYLVHEGFHPRTPPPELTGPLLGGPPLKPEESSPRMSKNIDLDKEKSGRSYLAMRLPTFLKLMSPKNGFNPNNLVMNIPVDGGPTIITTSD